MKIVNTSLKDNIGIIIGDDNTQNITIINKEIESNVLPFIDLQTKINTISSKVSYFPTNEDFKSGRVIINDNEKSRAFWALDNFDEVGVMGIGVSGKTTFSLVVGCKFILDGYNVLYFNFNENYDIMIIKDLLNVIDRYRDDKLLIILDDIHLFKHSLDLYHEIKKRTSSNFKVIYVGRKVYTLYDDEVNFFKTYITVIKGQFVHLKYDVSTFSNIYNYFNNKYKQGTYFKENLFSDWANIFQNEIRIFAWALSDFFNKNKRLPSKTSELNSKYVSTIIKKEYLSKMGEDIDRFLNLCRVAQLDLYTPVKLFKLKNPDSPLFTNFKEEGMVYQFYDKKNQRQIGMLSPRLAKLILNVYYEGDRVPRENKQKELNDFIQLIREIPELGPSMLSKVEIYKHHDKMYIHKELYKNEEFIKSVYGANKAFTSAQLLEIKKFFTHLEGNTNFRKWVGSFIFSNFDNYLAFVAEKGIIFTIDQVKYFKGYRKLRLAILMGLYGKYYDEILEDTNKIPIQMLTFFLDTIQKNAQHEKKLNDFLNKLIDDLTDNDGSHNLHNICFKKDIALDYIKSILNFIKSKKTNFFNEVIDELYLDLDSLSLRLIYTFSKNPQFMINFLNFLDENKKPSLPIIENIISKYGKQFKDEFNQKPKEMREVFLKLLIDKYPDYSDKINTLVLT